MELDKMARILYNLSLDMDYADSIELADLEIGELEKELSVLKKLDCACLLQALSVITSQNEHMEFWHEAMTRSDF